MSSKTREIQQSAALNGGKPADFSFKHLKALKAMGLEGARSSRVGGIPDRGPERRQFLTRSIWLNNNRLKSTANFDTVVDSMLEHPEQLAWVDFSFNYIVDIDESILKFPALKILYFHGNCIADVQQLLKLRRLTQLRNVTFHGNPIANLLNYRRFVVAALPQIVNLDFTPVLNNEKMSPAPTEFVKILQSKEK